MSRSRRARSAALVAAAYLGSAAIPVLAGSAHEVFHLVERVHEHHESQAHEEAHGDSHQGTPALPHSHGGGSPAHTHAAPVDALLTLARADHEQELAAVPALAHLDGHLPTGSLALIGPRVQGEAPPAIAPVPRAGPSHRPPVPPPRSPS
jgi:hypothetical protein